MTAPPLTALLAAESAMGGLMPIYIVAMAAIVYFLIIRPQRQQQKEHDGVLTSLKKGDDVVLSSGLLGKISAVADKTVSLEVASGVKVRVLKSSVQAKVTVTDDAAKSDDAAKKDDAKKDDAAKKEEK